MVINVPFFFTLVAGLLIAFALQLLLANLGIALGMTALEYLPSAHSKTSDSTSSESSPASQESKSIGNTIRTVGLAVGFGSLLTANTVLFIACFLAVKLSAATSMIVGAILGIVIWSAYFLLLVWLSSIAAGSVLSSMLGVVSLGWRGLRAIADAAFGSQPNSENSGLSEQIAAEIAGLGEAQRALSAASIDSMQAAVQRYLETSTATLNAVQPKELQELADQGSDSAERAIDVRALLETVQKWVSHSDLDFGQIQSHLTSFNQVVGQSIEAIGAVLQPSNTIQNDIEDYLLNTPLRSLTHKAIKSEFKSVICPVDIEPKRIQQQLNQLNRDSFADLLNQRDDLSDAKLAKLTDQLEVARLQVLEQVTQERDRVSNNHKTNHETNYETRDLQRQAQADAQAVWQKLVDWLSDRNHKLTARAIQQQMKTLLKESTVNLETLKLYLRDFDRTTILQILEDREDLTKKRVQQVCDRVEELWSELESRPEQESGKPNNFLNQVEIDLAQYLQSIDTSKFDLASIKERLKSFLESPQASILEISSLTTLIDWEKLTAALKEQGSLTEEQLTQVVEQAQQIIHGFSKAPQQLAVRAQTAIQNLPGYAEIPLQTVEDLRLNLLAQVEKAQQAAQNQVEDLKQQAQQQVKHARRAAVIASWWLFSIAFSSMVSSAIAGTLAIRN